MHLPRPIERNPPTWKDWVSIGGLAATIAVVFIQGGRIIESQDHMRLQLAAAISTLSVLKDDQGKLWTEMAKQQGTDALLSEQIRNLKSEVLLMDGIMDRHSGSNSRKDRAP